VPTGHVGFTASNPTGFGSMPDRRAGGAGRNRPARSAGHGRDRRVDRARRVALDAMRRITAEGGYANLVLGEVTAGLDKRDAGFVIELVSGTCRMQGSYDAVIEQAAGRKLSTLQPAVVNVLRLACHQLFAMRVPDHAAVGSSVDLAGACVGERVTGLVNAIVRRLAARDLGAWFDELSDGLAPREVLALRHGHPAWVADAFADALVSGDDELERLLAADNEPPVPMLVVRPGLAGVDDLVRAGGVPARWSPWGASRPGNPAEVPEVVDGRAGVQDEGSQLVIEAATRANSPDGPWLDLCAGPGGKSALLRGLAPGLLVSSEVQPHRAGLVAKALRAFPRTGHQVLVADATAPAWRPSAFGLVVADVPCTGLGALRRRPESRWRRDPASLAELTALQRRILDTAIASVARGGLVAYITCSPHPDETVGIVRQASGVEIEDAPALLPEVPDAASRLDERCIQLWPHLHGTDAMFCALLRRV